MGCSASADTRDVQPNVRRRESVACNPKRVMALPGAKPLIAAILA
jgi:hypothetical protein